MKKVMMFLSLALILATPTVAKQQTLETAIAGKHRTPGWVERDQYRHPLQTLTLFDVRPSHTVVEIWPGGGWYTEILAPYLRDDGLLIAAHYDSEEIPRPATDPTPARHSNRSWRLTARCTARSGSPR